MEHSADQADIPVTFAALDGRELSGLLVRSPAPLGALVVNGGTGFPREFYLKFARYAAQRGYHALVYDYRGMGASSRQPLQAENARMSDWGAYDIPAAFEWLAARFPEFPLFTVGHSIGGQMLGMLRDPERARAHVIIAASMGYWRWQHAPFRYQALFFWKIYGPLMLRRHGFVPRGRAWTGQALPRGVFEQWREWCLRPEHFAPELTGALRDNRFAELRGPVLSWAAEDDPIATRRAVPPFLALFPRAQIEHRWTKPRDIGARHIRHHGFFSERHQESLWRPVLDWIDARR